MAYATHLGGFADHSPCRHNQQLLIGCFASLMYDMRECGPRRSPVRPSLPRHVARKPGGPSSHISSMVEPSTFDHLEQICYGIIRQSYTAAGYFSAWVPWTHHSYGSCRLRPSIWCVRLHIWMRGGQTEPRFSPPRPPMVFLAGVGRRVVLGMGSWTMSARYHRHGIR